MKSLTLLTKYIARRPVWRLGSLLVLDVMLFGSFNATTAPAYILIIGLLALAATTYQLAYGALALANLYGAGVKHRHRLCLWSAGVAAGLAALQSLGELSLGEIAVLLPLAMIGYLYSLYLAKSRRGLSV